MQNLDLKAPVYVAGHRGMAGSAIMRRLQETGFSNLLTRTRDELDLLNQQQAMDFMTAHRPRYVLIPAGRVGGIHANNTYLTEFLYENLMIAVNLIHAAHQCGVERLVYMGSSCQYPVGAAQPIQEDALLTGPFESTNEFYALAKSSGIKLCEAYRRQYGADFRALVPCNLYGPGDNYSLENGHVAAALLRKFHIAKEEERAQVEVWGTGKPRREFLYVDDMAEACLFLLGVPEEKFQAVAGKRFCHINAGTGEDVSIRELTEIMSRVTGYEGRIHWDTSKPDGVDAKRMDVSKIAKLGWRYRYDLESGMKLAYQWFLEHQDSLRL